MRTSARHVKHLEVEGNFGKGSPKLYDVHREGACIMHVSRASIGVRYQVSSGVQLQEIKSLKAA